MQATKPLAITGYAYRLPGAATPGEFWNMLIAGGTAIGEIPSARIPDWMTHTRPDVPGRISRLRAGLIPDPYGFDPEFFGISPREAAHMDPQQRQLLEVSVNALMHAGIRLEDIAGQPVGVFVGFGNAWSNIDRLEPRSVESFSAIGSDGTGLANRISHCLGLIGPSIPLATACSSSLNAFHVAANALRLGDVDCAIVCGVNILDNPNFHLLLEKAGLLSPEGISKAFDAQADGYVRAEGVAAIVLKREEDAVIAGDRIRATVIASASNAAGQSSGISQPSERSQVRLIESTCDRFGVNPADIAYVEAHGTGTKVGDPIECRALGEAIGRHRPKGDPLLVGSLKTNIGHMEANAGMGGLLKCVHILENRIIPPSLHFKTPNPDIAFKDLNLAVVTEPTPLAGKSEQTAIVAVNTFGFGGSNAHVVLQSPPPLAERGEHLPKVHQILLPVSGKSEDARDRAAEEMAVFLRDNPDISTSDLMHTALRRRDIFDYRTIVLAEGRDALIRALETGSAEADPLFQDHVTESGQRTVSGKPAFVFAGNGPQWYAMGRDLFENALCFREVFQDIDTRFAERSGISLVEEIHREEAESRMAATEIAQPALFALQLGIVAELERRGLKPGAVIGHSVGEVAAAVVCGALSVDQGVDVIHHRSRLQGLTAGKGRMAALGLSAEDALAWIGTEAGTIDIASDNAPTGVTLAGPDDALARLRDRADREGVFFRLLRLNYAFHSPAMDEIRDPLLEALSDLDPKQSSTPFISTVEGAAFDTRKLTADYWWRNVRAPVQFRQAMTCLCDMGFQSAIEIGPHPVLKAYVQETAKALSAPFATIDTLHRQQPEVKDLDRTVIRAVTNGIELETGAWGGSQGHLVDLPLYPFSHISPRPVMKDRLAEIEHPLLGRRTDPVDTCWESDLSLDSHPYFAGHKAMGITLLPAAAYVETIMAMARSLFGDTACEISDFRIEAGLALTPGTIFRFRTQLHEDTGFRLSSRPALDDKAPWTLHARGYLTRARSEPDCLVPESPSGESRDADWFYDHCRRFGFDYSGCFRAVGASRVGAGTFEAEIGFRPDHPRTGTRSDWVEDYIFHPAEIDAGLQGVIGIFAAGTPVALPSGARRIRASFPVRPIATARVALTEQTDVQGKFDIDFLDDTGTPVLNFLHYTCDVTQTKQNESRAYDDFGYRWSVRKRFDHLPAIVLEDLVPPSSGKDTDTPVGGRPVPEEALSGYLAARAARITDLIGDPASLDPLYLPLAQRLGKVTEHAVVEPASDTGDILARVPSAGPDLAFFDFCTASMPNVLKGEMDALNLLEEGDGRRLLRSLCRNGHQARAIANAMMVAIRRFIASVPPKRPLRILEIGVSRSSVSKRLGSSLRRGGISYQVTDVILDEEDHHVSISNSAGMDVDGIVLDPAVVSDFDQLDGLFDIVLANDQVQECPDFGETLRAIRDRLAPGGLLLAAFHQPGLFGDMTFGLFPQMWETEDGRAGAWQTPNEIAGAFEALDWPCVQQPIPNTLFPVLLVAATGSEAPEQMAIAPIQDAAGITETDTTFFVLSSDPDDPLSPLLGKGLSDKGRNVIQTPFGSNVESIREGVGILQNLVEAAGEGALHVVVLAPQAPVNPMDADICIAMAAIVSLLHDRGSRDRLILVTRGLHPDPDDPIAASAMLHPANGISWGFSRAVSSEMPTVRCIRIDLGSDPAASAALAQELTTLVIEGDEDDEFLITKNGLYSGRLHTITNGSQRPETQKVENFAAGLSGENSLNGFRWYPLPGLEPGPGEVAVRVEATGLNYKDILLALGILPATLIRHGLNGPMTGLECAGTILSVGPGEEEFHPGDPVMVFAPGALASNVLVDRRFIARRPSKTSAAEAATLPVAFCTAWHALDTLARLDAADSVLIHGGAGGVGQAAIQIAKLKGATIIATAGSEERRGQLRRQGVHHVFNSRELAFVDDVERVTNGAGVDVVLNSIAGDGMRAGLRLLKPFGRFVEIGKRDFVDNRALNMGDLIDNIAYFAVDLDQMVSSAPEKLQALLITVAEHVERGDLTPLPFSTFQPTQLVEAYETLRQSRQFGKVVVTYDDRPVISAPPKGPAAAFRADRTYVVTGGTRGFGLKVSEYLLDRGARQLLLINRSGSAPAEADAFMSKARDAGASIRIVGADTADGEQLRETLTSAREQNMPPIGGVFHAAVTYGDKTILNLEAELHRSVLGPKAQGAFHLDRLTAAEPVEHFVLFSSVSAIVGTAGQASYVAANMYLDVLAEARRARGLPALVVNLSGLDGAGILAQQNEESARIRELLTQRSALELIDADDAILFLDRAIATGAAQTGIGDLPVARMRDFASASGFRRYEPFLAALGTNDRKEDRDHADWREQTDPEARRRDFERTVIQIVSETLLLPPARIDRGRTLLQLGADSLLGLQIRLALEERLGIRINSIVALHDLTVTSLIDDLYRLAETAGANVADMSPKAAAVEVADEFVPLSCQQQSFWDIDRDTTEGGSVYTVSGALRINGALDRSALQRAAQALVNRHDILRTVFALRNGKPLQKVGSATKEIIQFQTGGGETDEDIKRLTRDLASTPFDLEHGPLLRMVLREIGPDSHALMVAAHHMILDGWSVERILQEVAADYLATAMSGQPVEDRATVTQYAEYASWQAEAIASGKLAEARTNWLEMLGPRPVAASLVTRQAGPNAGREAGTTQFEIPPGLHEALKGLSVRSNTSLFTILVTALALLVNRLSGLRDMILATVVAGRSEARWSPVVGPLFNRVPLRFRFEDADTFKSLLGKARETVLKALENDHVPYSLIIQDARDSGLLSDTDTTLHTIQLVLHNQFRTQLDTVLPGLAIRQIPVERDLARFELAIDLYEATDGGLLGLLEYRRALFDEDEIEEIRVTFLQILGDIAQSTETTLLRSLNSVSA